MADGKVTLDTELDDKGLKSGLSNLGSKISNFAKAGVAGIAALTAGLGSIAKKSVEAFGEFEQLKGGVETLFKDSADTIMNYAKNAYNTAGLSANNYMETVTSFSASLLQSLKGDTAAAAKYADMAVRDMADNANKMGTAIGSIQWAYQGFAKQNYTMLDNLKLGYGGTKTEMERLIHDASQLTDIQKKLNVQVKDGDMSFANIVQAIHVMQASLDILGTTEKEAAQTFQGSLNSMKASWENLLTAFGDPEADIGEYFDTFINSLETFLQNAMPILERVLTGMSSVMDKFAPLLADKLPGIIAEVLPKLVDAAGKIAAGLIANLPAILGAVWQTLSQDIGNGFAGIMLLLAVKGQGIITGIGSLLGKGLGLIPWQSIFSPIAEKVVSGLTTVFAPIGQTIAGVGSKLIFKMLEGMDGAISAVPGIVSKLGGVLSSAFSPLVSSLGSVFSAIPGLITSAFSGIAGFFGTLTSTLAPIMTTFWSVITGPVGIVIAVIAAVIGIFVLLYNTFEPFRDFVDTFVKGIQQIFSGDFAGAAETFRGLWQGVADFWMNLWQGVLDFFGGIIDGIIGFFTGIGDWIANNWQSILLFILNPIAGIFNYFYNNCEEFRNFIDGIINSVIEFFQKLPENVGNVINAVVDWFIQLPGRVWEGLVLVVSKVQEWAGDLWNAGVNAASNLLNAIINIISSIPGRMWEFGRNIVEGIWNGISNAVGWLMDKLKGFADNIVKGVQAFFGIGSPSKRFRDQVGKWLPQGIKVGWDVEWKKMDFMSQVRTDVENGINKLQTALNINNEERQLQAIPVKEAAAGDGVQLNFYANEFSPDAVYQKFYQQQTYGLARSY